MKFSHPLALVGLLAFHTLLLLHGIRCPFATRNEVAHVPAGLACWQTGTFCSYRIALKVEGRQLPFEK